MHDTTAQWIAQNKTTKSTIKYIINNIKSLATLSYGGQQQHQFNVAENQWIQNRIKCVLINQTIK